MIEGPLVVDRKDGCVRVQLHWNRFRVECDIDKFEVRQGVCDSGSTIEILIFPKVSAQKKVDVAAEMSRFEREEILRT